MTLNGDQERIRLRQERILGGARRIDPPAEITEEMRVLAGAPRGFGEVGVLPEVYAVMLQNTGLLSRFRGMGEFFLVDNRLPVRDRELAVLRIAWLTLSPYEWGEHVMIAKRCGVADVEIERITQGSGAEGWSAHDRAILTGVEELASDAMISQATWDVLSQSWDDGQMVEFPFLVGTYQTLAYFLNSVGVRLRETNAGLSAR